MLRKTRRRQSFTAGVIFWVTLGAALATGRAADAALIWQLAGDSLNGSLSQGAPVDSWTAIAGPNATAQAGSQPTFLTNAFAGHSAVRFDGLNDALSGAISPSGQLSIFVMLRPNVLSANAHLFLNNHFGSGGAGGFNAFIYDTTGPADHLGLQTSVGTGWPGGANFMDVGSTLVSGMPVLFGAVIGASSTELFQDGTLIASNGAGAIAAGVAATTIGMDGNAPGTSYLNGDIAEIRIYGTALDAATRQAVEASLIATYVTGVPEPASLGLPTLAAVALLRGRRRPR